MMSKFFIFLVLKLTQSYDENSNCILEICAIFLFYNLNVNKDVSHSLFTKKGEMTPDPQMN